MISDASPALVPAVSPLNKKANCPILISAPTAMIAGQLAGRGKRNNSGIKIAKRSPTNKSGGSSSKPSFMPVKFDPHARITTITSAMSRGGISFGCRVGGLWMGASWAEKTPPPGKAQRGARIGKNDKARSHGPGLVSVWVVRP